MEACNFRAIWTTNSTFIQLLCLRTHWVVDGTEDSKVDRIQDLQNVSTRATDMVNNNLTKQ